MVEQRHRLLNPQLPGTRSVSIACKFEQKPSASLELSTISSPMKAHATPCARAVDNLFVYTRHQMCLSAQSATRVSAMS